MQQRLASTFCILSIAAQTLVAQGSESDFMRSMGKMYVVVAVLGLIFIILIAYLVYLDRKTRKLEKQMEHGHQQGE